MECVALLLAALLSSGAVLSAKVEVFPMWAEVSVGQNVSMLCRVSEPIRYCRIKVPGLAAPLNLDPLRGPVPPSNGVYLGEGLDKGHCGVSLPRVEAKNNGVFKCFVGTAAEDHESQGTMTVTVARAGGTVDGERELDKCDFIYRSPVVAKNVVVVLGLNGEGKSTLTHFLAHRDKLVAVGNLENPGLHIEGNTTLGLNLTSPTLFPELVQGEQLSFVDSPGLEGTGGICLRVQQARAVASVLRNAKKVKILVVLDYSDLDYKAPSLGARLVQTAKILSHLIKKPLRYRNSIGLVLTRAPYVNCLPKLVRKVKRLKEEAHWSITSLIKSIETAKVVIANEKTKENVQTLLGLFKNEDSPLHVFREPNATGMVKADYHSEDRNIILNMTRNLAFVSPETGDFELGLSNDVLPIFKNWLSRPLDKLLSAVKALATEVVTKIVQTSRAVLESENRQWDGIFCLEQLQGMADLAINNAEKCYKFQQAMPSVLGNLFKYRDVINIFYDVVPHSHKQQIMEPIKNALKFSKQLKNCTEEYFVQTEINRKCARDRLKEIHLNDTSLRAPDTVDLKICGCGF